VVSFTPLPLYPQGRVPGTHWTGGWVGPRAILDAVHKFKTPDPPVWGFCGMLVTPSHINIHLLVCFRITLRWRCEEPAAHRQTGALPLYRVPRGIEGNGRNLRKPASVKPLPTGMLSWGVCGNTRFSSRFMVTYRMTIRYEHCLG
jgi:hypothetical protein